MNILIGTCSWKYDSWRGLIYPGSGKINYLKEYSKHYKSLEIDQWFWSLFGEESVKLPDPGVVNDYLNSIPEDFRFTIKVPNSITLTHFYSHHIKGKKGPGNKNPHFLSIELFNSFLKTIEPLLKNTGALLFQFEYLNRQKINSLDDLLIHLSTFFKDCSKDIPIAIELRNPSFLDHKYFEFLNNNKIYHIFPQGYYMPDIAEIYHKYHEYISGLTVIRLLGKNRNEIEKITKKSWDKIVFPEDKDLSNLVEVLDDLEKRGIKVFLNVNNHYEGSAPLTIKKIQELLNKKNK
jgi:uncharacterized protein YecE (DUF72 family)